MPASAKKRFTEQMLEKLRPPATRRLEIADDLCSGLVLRVTDRGVRTLATIYRVSGEGGVSPEGRVLAGKQHRITLGHWPAIKLSDARDRAREIVTTARGGRDARRVTAETVSARQQNTFSAVLARHIAQDASLTTSSWRNVDRVLRLHAVPKFGDRRADVHGLLDELVAAGKVGTAREVRKHLSKLFNWAADRELIPSEVEARTERHDERGHVELDRAGARFRGLEGGVSARAVE